MNAMFICKKYKGNISEFESRKSDFILRLNSFDVTITPELHHIKNILWFLGGNWWCRFLKAKYISTLDVKYRYLAAEQSLLFHISYFKMSQMVLMGDSSILQTGQFTHLDSFTIKQHFCK